ncbi:hypothetical protein HDU97_008283 [Phlyctochytrium planicorne]|nr:hypothetical protein HDU97_008283 [Phlyctochytrium planicorne]
MPGTAKKKEEITMLKPKVSKQDELKFDEVQETIKQQMNSLNQKEWMTKEFIERIEKNPALARALSDPEFQQATQEMQTNPHAAFAKYSKKRPDLILALREFSGLLGDQLEKMDSTGARHQTQAASSNGNKFNIPDDLPDHEKTLVAKVLGDKDLQVPFSFIRELTLKSILQDPAMQKLLLSIRNNPPEFQRCELNQHVTNQETEYGTLVIEKLN